MKRRMAQATEKRMMKTGRRALFAEPADRKIGA